MEFSLCFPIKSSHYLAMSSLLRLQRCYELELPCVMCAGRLCEEDVTMQGENLNNVQIRKLKI